MSVKRSLQNTLVFTLGAAWGAGMMALLDPGRGAWRRSWVRDKFARFGHWAGDRANKRIRDLNYRARGSVAEIRSSIRERGSVITDEVLEERVRAQIGHVLSHPAAIDVEAHEGHVRLSGPILRGELEKVKHRLDETRGVRDYDLALTEHETDDNVPGLQGTSRWQRKRARRA